MLGSLGDGVFVTTLPEELFAAGKNFKQIRVSRLFRRPERSLGIMLSEEVPSKRHRFEMVEDTNPAPNKRQRLNAEAYGKVALTPSVDLAGIVTTQAKATYFSPQTCNIALPVADHVVFDAARRHDLWGSLSNADLGCFNNCYPFVYHTVDEHGEPTSAWLLGLTHFSGSAVINWPCTL